MTWHCEVGDVPTVYYSFGGQAARQTVTFHLSPIDVRVLTAEEEAKEKGDSGQQVSEPCPALNTLCGVTYSAIFRLGDNYGYEPGQRNEFFSPGWIMQETYLSFMYEGDDTWEYNYSDFAFVWRIEATYFYRFSPGIVRRSPPQYYQDLIDEENGIIVGGWPDGWSLRDSCFPKGGSPQSCYTGQPPPPPPPDKDRCIIKVLYGGKEIWRSEGKCPCTYDVACKNDCPPGFLKLKSNNPKGFCCIKCQDIKTEAAQIKSLLRQRNG